MGSRVPLLGFAFVLISSSSASSLPCTSYINTTYLSVGGSLSGTTLQSADRNNGGTATLNSNSNWGGQGSACLAFSNEIDGIFDLDYSKLSVAPALGNTVNNGTTSLITYGGGFKIWPGDHRLGFTFYGGMAQFTQFKGLSSSTFQMDTITVPFAAVGLTGLLVDSSFIKMGLELAALYYFPVSSSIYQTQGNTEGQALGFIRLDLFSRLFLELDAGARLMSQNSNLVTQQESDVDYGVKLILPLGPVDGPISWHSHPYYGP